MTSSASLGGSVSSRWDRVGDLRVHSRVPAAAPRAATAGPRPVLVLVHGLGVSSRYMTRLLRLLADEHQVLAPDLPGFGRSSRPPRPLTLSELADVLVAWMDAVGIGRAALLGHSLGCQVVAHVADRHPTQISCLVLASPCRDPSARRPWQQAWRLLRDGPREAPSLLPLAVGDYLRAGPRRMWSTLRESMRTDAAHRLSRLTVPVLVVRGDRDPVVSAAWAGRIAEMTGGELVTLTGAPHAVNWTTAEALAAAVRPFLAEHRQDPDPPAPR